LAALAFAASSPSREIAYSRTFVSTKRTIVQLVARYPIGRPEALDLTLDPALLRLQLRELVAGRQRAKVAGDESTDRGAALSGPDAGSPVDVLGH